MEYILQYKSDLIERVYSTWRVPLVEQKLHIFPKYLISHPGFIEVRVA
jgi:hypothetical protein